MRGYYATLQEFAVLREAANLKTITIQDDFKGTPTRSRGRFTQLVILADSSRQRTVMVEWLKGAGAAFHS
jgi:hypothetical protein